MNKYSKLWVALAGALVAFLMNFYGASNAEVQLVIGILTALGVYGVPNTPAAPTL